MTLRSLNKLLKRFDQNFFPKITGDGVVRVYCNEFKLKPYSLDDKVTLLYPVNEPYHVFSLTDTWGYWGQPCDYGYMPLYQKLSQIRLDNAERLMREIEASESKAKEASDRAIRNTTEAMAYEMRDVIKEETKDVVFHQMDKRNDKRFLNDKKLKGI